MIKKNSGSISSWWKKSQILAKQYHGFALFFFIDRIYCRIRYGISLSHDYEWFNIYGLNRYAKDALFTEGRYSKTCKWFFPTEMRNAVDSKIGFMRNFKEFHKRDFLVLPCEKECVVEFLKKHKQAFLKANVSYGGHGVSLVSLQDIVNDESRLEYVSNYCGILDEPVIQHDEMVKLNPSSVSTVRITTMVEKEGDIRILGYSFRLGKAGNVADNVGVGGALFQVDGDEGVIVGYGKTFQGERILKSTTGVILPGFKIPYWEQILNEVKRAAAKFPEARFVGWDIAVGKDGPVFIEANMGTGPTPCQFDYEYGIWYYLKEQRR